MASPASPDRTLHPCNEVEGLFVLLKASLMALLLAPLALLVASARGTAVGPCRGTACPLVGPPVLAEDAHNEDTPRPTRATPLPGLSGRHGNTSIRSFGGTRQGGHNR